MTRHAPGIAVHDPEVQSEDVSKVTLRYYDMSLGLQLNQARIHLIVFFFFSDNS